VRSAFDVIVSEWAKQLFDASKHEGFFRRRQTVTFTTPSKMLQPPLRHCLPSCLVVA
jgi:hypothetical protein